MIHMSPDNGVMVSLLGPVTANLPNGAVIAVTGDYPFEDNVTITVSKAPSGGMPLYVRIPSWATAATMSINGQPSFSVGAANGTMYKVGLCASLLPNRPSQRAI